MDISDNGDIGMPTISKKSGLLNCGHPPSLLRQIDVYHEEIVNWPLESRISLSHVQQLQSTILQNPSDDPLVNPRITPLRW